MSLTNDHNPSDIENPELSTPGAIQKVPYASLDHLREKVETCLILQKKVQQEKNAFLGEIYTREDGEWVIRQFDLFQQKHHTHFENIDTMHRLQKKMYRTFMEDLLKTFDCPAEKEMKAEADLIQREARKILRSFDPAVFFKEYERGMETEMKRKISHYFEHLKIDAFDTNGNFYRRYRRGREYFFEKLSSANLGRFIDSFCYGEMLALDCAMEALGYDSRREYPDQYITDYLTRRGMWESEIFTLTAQMEKLGLGSLEIGISDKMAKQGMGLSAFTRVLSWFSREKIEMVLRKNPHYEGYFEEHDRLKEAEQRLKESMLQAIPDSYIDLFPLARKMHRHFILHIGPTNSGKSYEALNALKEAKQGIYLAPLRLLAFEKFEELNEEGIPTCMKTGEEEIMVEGARIQSSTIEMADLIKEYDIAVIDEAQMLADNQRGSSWTMAILGLCCPTIHVCMALESQELVQKLITECGDTFEIREHHRLVPLSVEEPREEIFPSNARRGDAFIVFSRKEAHSVAQELRDHGIRCSMIYGRLPYDVRRNEVKKYITGETDVVVATDAIGMGLNLPIRRVIFLKVSKYDGVSNRYLLPEEVRQIAGRAGRYGIFEEGSVVFETERTPRSISSALTAKPEMLEKASIGFPSSLLGMEGKVSTILDQWSRIPPKEGYEVGDVTRERDLALLLEKGCDDKKFIYSFVSIKFDEKDEKLLNLWLQLFNLERKGRGGILRFIPQKVENEMYDLEEAFKVCDLLYRYAELFHHEDELPPLMEKKEEISERLRVLLDRMKPQRRTRKKAERSKV